LKFIFRTILRALPKPLESIIQYLRFALIKSKQLGARKDYHISDEQIKYVHLMECVNYVRVNSPMGVPQVFFEFGCHSGRTFSAIVNAARYLDMQKAEFYAFDSFEGLPDTKVKEDGIFKTGEFSTSESDFKKIVKQKTNLELDNNHIVKGFYSESLTKKLQSRMPKVGMVHIDVDLYSSTMDILEFIKPLMVVGTILIFDDWYCFPPGLNKGEMRAVKEFTEMNPDFRLEEWKAYSTFGKSFFVSSLP
tara:strand:+ start:861 stop:1607 length:747 start_codon:yes stop_codon:yes gene_type:complete